MGSRSLIAALVVVHLACGIHTALNKSATHDEIWHLPVGILNWQTGRFDQDTLNPPLTRMWAAIPAVIAGVNVESGRDASEIADRFVLQHEDFQRWYVWGRAFNLLLSGAAMLILVAWANRWYGGTGAIIAGILYTTCPNILAHSSLVTPDTGLMLGTVATLFFLSRWLESRGRRWTILLGLALGLTQTTKFTAILLYPCVLLAWLFGGRTGRAAAGATTPDDAAKPTRRAWELPLALAISLLVWNAAYLFRGTGETLRSLPLQSRTLQGLRDALGPLSDCPLPWPRDYLAGLDRQRSVMEQQHPIFLDDRWNVTGFPDYFLRTLEYKLPHVLQLAAVLGLFVMLFDRRPGKRRRLLIVWPTIVLLLGIASGSSMQLGVRYILPLLPLFMLAAAALALPLAKVPRAVGIPLLLVFAVLCGASLRFHPHHLAYFNEWAGGPVGGRHHLLDSNLDWGQDLHLVRRFMDEHHLPDIQLAYFGTLPPEALGIIYEIPPAWRPAPGWHAVSVNYVMGRPHLLHLPDGSDRPVDLNEFAYFQQLTPVARLGYSIDVYHIPE